jgi:hypothetical protein
MDYEEKVVKASWEAMKGKSLAESLTPEEIEKAVLTLADVYIALGVKLIEENDDAESS